MERAFAYTEIRGRVGKLIQRDYPSGSGFVSGSLLIPLPVMLLRCPQRGCLVDPRDMEQLHTRADLCPADRSLETIEGLTLELEEARRLAIARGNPSAAVLAVIAKAKLHGLISRDQAGSRSEKVVEAIPHPQPTASEPQRKAPQGHFPGWPLVMGPFQPEPPQTPSVRLPGLSGGHRGPGHSISWM